MKLCPNAACSFLKTYGEVAEYRNEIVHCIDCGALLVDSALTSPLAEEARHAEEQAEEEEDSDDLVVIATFDHPLQAHIHRAHLEAEGIPAFLFDEHMMTNNWLMTNALGGIRLAVPETAREEALAILADSDDTTEVETDDEAVDGTDEAVDEEMDEAIRPVPCLRCQGKLKYLKEYRFDSEDNNRGLFGVLFDVEERLIFDIYVCTNCRHTEFIFKGSAKWFD